MPYEENNFESLVDLLIATLGSARNTRLFKSILFERKLKRYKKRSIQATLSRLQSKGYAGKSSLGWFITQKGKTQLKSNKDKHLFKYIESPFSKNETHKIIVSFDIPENNRRARTWLRNQIKVFGYKMLQQSLWIGPGPLSAPFLKRLEDLNIRKNIKTFKIKGRNQK